jgi:phospholipase/carboxylesterase
MLLFTVVHLSLITSHSIQPFPLEPSKNMNSDFSLTHISRPPLEKGEGPTPLLLLLHGVGSNEEDLMGLAPYLDPHWHLISARAPIEMGINQYGWYWVQIGARGRMGYDKEEARASLSLLLTFIEEVKRAYDIEPTHLYLMGFSQGAILSSAVLLTEPEVVAGGVLMSGRSVMDFVELPAAPERLSDKPVLIVHGLYDEVLPISEGRALRDTFAALPVALEYAEYPMGHSVSLESLQKVREWLTAVISEK